VSASQSPRPLRIAYPFSSLQIGGAELRALSLVERLPRDSFEVDFLSLVGAGALDHRAKAAGARIHYIGSSALHDSPAIARAVGRVSKFARYATLARSSRYDIIDAWLYPTDVFVALGRGVTRTPIVMSGRADLLPRTAFGPLSPRVDAMVNGLVDAIVANSEAVASAHRGRRGVRPSALHVIRNGVELYDPITPQEQIRIRSELGAADGDVLIGSVGMLRAEKRHALLIDAFASLARSRPNLRLAIIGDGPMREQLERQVARLGVGSMVRMPGAVVDVRRYFDAFDVVTLSSSSEGLPNALLQGAAAGKPCVTTAAGGAVEVVVDGVTGLVVPTEDQGALASALARTSLDADLRKRFGSAAREYMASNFGMDRFVQEWRKLYEGLAAAKGLVR
jgi:glycosyltransferase involved in cell wall biosynthesis